MAIVIVVGGGMVLDHSLDIGVMVAFLFYVQRFFDPIRSLTLQYSTMQRAMASGQRIFEVTDVTVDIADRPDAEDPEEINGAIEFRNVTFGYGDGRRVRVPRATDTSGYRPHRAPRREHLRQTLCRECIERAEVDDAAQPRRGGSEAAGRGAASGGRR